MGSPAMRLAALVPMRHHSQRVTGKNYRVLGGRPLFHHVLQTLQQVPEIHEIAVDTDSPIIVDGLQHHFPAVRLILRPDHLRGDSIPMNEILLHDVAVVGADHYLQTHSTNPLVKPQTFSRAINTYLSGLAVHDSLFSVTRRQSRFYDAQGEPLNHDPRELLQTQDLPPVYEENSCLYLFSGGVLRANRHRIGRTPALFEIDAAEAWDIDDEVDIEICQFLIEHGSGRAAPGGSLSSEG